MSASGFVWFGLVSLFNGISTLFRLFNAKAILLEEQEWYYLTHSWEDKGVHTFPKGIWPKMNVIARLEYEFAYYDSAVHRFNHYNTRTPRQQVDFTVPTVKRKKKLWEISSTCNRFRLVWFSFMTYQSLSVI